MQKIKIYIFSPYSSIGGDTLSLSRLIKKLDNNLYEISFISLKKPKISNYIKQKNLKIINLKTSRSILSLAKIINVIRFDLKLDYNKYIFISNQNFANIISSFLKIVFGKKIKLILIERNHLDEFKYQKNFKNFFIKKLIKVAYKKADLVIGISKKLSNDLSKYINKKVVTIYNPAFDKSVYKKAKKKTIFRKKNLILSVGRFENQKDPFTMLKAFKIVNDRIDCNLLMIGFGSMYKEMVDYVRLNNLQKKVIILRNVKNAFPYYKLAKIFVLHSKYEGFGNVLVEAAMFNIPIISSKCNSGPKEILGEGKYGLLFDVGNYKSLSKKIIQLLDKKKNKPSIEFKNSLKRFEINKIISKYNDIFMRI